MVTREAELNELARRVRDAIREELRVSSRGLPFRVSLVHRDKGLLHLVLEPEDKRSILDESLEEGGLRWVGETTGAAEVISVVPSVSAVNGQLTAGQPPKPGSIVFINPPRYLEALLELWDQNEWALRFTKGFFDLGENQVIWPHDVPFSPFSSLRPAQQQSFGLVRWRTSFLWGPPGTGKTHTLGRLLASYLVNHSKDRILLLSTTNVAVDLAILAVDDALQEMRPAVRPICYRFGSRFDPQRFRDRRHLIPLRDKNLVEQLRQHYENVPDPSDAENYRVWKKRRDNLREEIRKENLAFLGQARLATMTTTLAAFDFSNLGKYDLVVFDEASQVGKAQAMTFAHLGSRALFAGDPQQLAPVAQANTEDVTRWLGQSPFQWRDRSALQQATCLLDEQWRMAKPISDAVSEIFYESKLRVADPAVVDPIWNANRSAKRTTLLGTENLVLIDTRSSPTPARQFRGYECIESARIAAALVVDHVLSWEIEDLKTDVIILTPYRAQRRKIADEVRSIGAPESIVSTVHRAQGSERQIVIFDPVCPTADFVSGEEGLRLVNVAFSRAKCRLIVMLQNGWESHPALYRLTRQHPRIVLKADDVDRLLLKKVPPLRVIKPEPVQNVRPPTPRITQTVPQSLAEEFADELRARITATASKPFIQRAAQALRDKAKFKKLTFAEIDAAVDNVFRTRSLPRR